MKLHYFHGPGPLRTLVLSRQDRRVELHLKKVGDETWALVALTGARSGQPDRSRCQGPYPTPERAESALRSIIGSLLESGYQPLRQEPVIWSVMAQRLARGLRDGPVSSPGKYLFDPDQYEPII